MTSFAVLALAVLQITRASPLVSDGENLTVPPYNGGPPCPPITIEPPLCPLCSCNPPPNCIPRKTSIRCLIACPIDLSQAS
ncbi:hypothetical protein Y032_0253g266 [Ancylostoma ceylanicum]|nr:hypothetical protein Y032_0253g266 [Ancylostoma ceylanicum]